MVDPDQHSQLRVLERFFDALQSISTRHSILSGVKGKFDISIFCAVSIGAGSTIELSVWIFNLEKTEKL